MTAPLMILAVFAAIGGFINITNNYGSQDYGSKFVGEHEQLSIGQQLLEPLHSIGPMICGLVAVLVGWLIAKSLYSNVSSDPLPAKLGALATWMKNKFYFDEIYEATVIRAHDLIAAISGWIDEWIVEGCGIGFIRGGTNLSGRMLRHLQTGNLQTYAFIFVFGVAVLLYFVLGK